MFDPVSYALEEEQRSRASLGSGAPMRIDTSLLDRDRADQDATDRFEATVASTPGYSSGSSGLSDGSTPDDWQRVALQPKSFRRGGFGGKDYTYDPRVALGTELARAAAERQQVTSAAPAEAEAKMAGEDARVRRLVQAGYSQKDAARQVYGGPRTVAEEQELLRTRSGDQMARDRMIQDQINTRQEDEQAARRELQTLLERSRSGDRESTLKLRQAQILLQQKNTEYKEAQRNQFINALGVPPAGGAASDADLHGQVDQHLSQVTSIEQGRKAAVDGVKTALTKAQPGAGGAAAGAGTAAAPTFVSDDDIESVIGGKVAPRAPAPVGASSTATGAAPKASAKPMSPQQAAQAAKDPGYKAWLASKGYDVSKVP